MTAFKTLKLTVLSAVIAAGISLSPAYAAGTTPLSLVNQFDSTGHPLSACQVYFYVAGTVATPQDSFADFGLTTKNPNPLPCDQFARVPLHWLADGLIHVRLIDGNGTSYVDTTMQVLGPSSGGGGGGGTVDPTSIMATGDEKIKYGTGALSGWVRENGLTIGNAVSGATERANADTQALFIYLYTTDPNLVVSGGRTGNALNDFSANKTIAVPDMRGRLSAALDDMGNSPAGRLTSAYFGASGVCSGALGTTLGVACGGESQTLSLAQLPTGITGAVTTFPNGNNGNFVPVNSTFWTFASLTPSGSGTVVPSSGSGATIVGTNLFSGTSTSNNTGGGAHPNVQPTMLKTFYIKL